MLEKIKSIIATQKTLPSYGGDECSDYSLPRKFIKFLLILIIFLHIIILSKLMFFPYPELFIYPYLANHGLKPYSQILDQHFPGLIFLPINFDNLGMNNEVVARIWSIAVVVLIQVLLFFVASRILKSQKRALVVNILYLLWQPFFEGWILWIDSFLPLFLLSAVYALNQRWIFLTGVLLGIGIVFKQTLIPLSGFVFIYLIWVFKDIKVILRYFLGLTLPVMLMIFYLWGIGVLGDFWYWTVIFNLTTYAQFGRGIGPTPAHFSRVLLVFGSAFLVIRKIRLVEAQILLIFLVGTLLGLTTRFDFVHFQPALPFAILAFVYMFRRLGKLERLGIIGYTFITVWWLNIFYQGHISNKVFFFDQQTKLVASKIKQSTKSTDKIFVFGAPPHLYQMAERLPAGDLFVFQFPWFLKMAEDRILEGIKKDPPQIIISDRTVEIEGQKITDFAKKLDYYIHQNYQSIDKVGTTDILRIKNP